MEQSVKKTLSRSSGWLRKLRRVSGLTLIMLLAIVINVQASIYSESVKFDLKMKKASLKEVFQTITDQSEFKFIYNNNIVDDKQKVSVTTEGARVEEILDEILPKQNLEYKVIDRQVIVFPAEVEQLNVNDHFSPVFEITIVPELTRIIVPLCSSIFTNRPNLPRSKVKGFLSPLLSKV